MNSRLIAGALVLVAAGALPGQDIDLGGRVEDMSGQPLAGASVWLVKQNLRTTTASDGTYGFLRLAVARRAGRPAEGVVPSVVAGRLQVHVREQQTRVHVEAFDLRGRLAAPTIGEVVGPGSYEYVLPLQHGATQVRFLRVQVGSERHILGCMGQAARPPVKLEPPMAAAAGAGKASADAAALALDTLQVSLAGYVAKAVLVSSYSQYLVTRLALDDGLGFTINHGDIYVVKDTCVLVVRDAQRVLTSVRFTQTEMGGVPDFGGAASQAVSDTLVEFPWVLPKGASGKTVYAQRTFADSHVDTVEDGILVRPWQVTVTLHNDTSGTAPAMRRFAEAEYVQGAGICDGYVVYRPWVDFSVDIGGDSSFAEEFDAWLVMPRNQVYLGSVTYTLRTSRQACALGGMGAAHDRSRVYRYSFCPDSADGARNLDTVAVVEHSSYYGDTVVKILGPGEPGRVYDTLRYLPRNYVVGAGRKEMALVLSSRGRYFDDERTVEFSARLDPSLPAVLYYDAYPPAVYRDWWEYVYPIDGAVIDSPFTVDLNTTGEIYDPSGQQLKQRGLVWDGGMANIIGIDLILAEMTEEAASRWYAESLWNKVTLSQLLSARHYRFGFPIPVPGPRIYPVAWYGIDPSQWNDGWYYVAFVTTDQYGNRDIAPFNAATGKDYAITHNPQHWRIVTPYHTF